MLDRVERTPKQIYINACCHDSFHNRARFKRFTPCMTTMACVTQTGCIELRATDSSQDGNRIDTDTIYIRIYIELRRTWAFPWQPEFPLKKGHVINFPLSILIFQKYIMNESE